MILFTSTREFRLGFFIHAVSFELSLGWVGFMILWSKSNAVPAVLEGLPEIPDLGNGICQRCMSHDWSRANLDNHGFVTACNQCPGKPELKGSQ
jgi:hypothetical protein